MTITAIKKKGSRLIQIEVDSQQVITLDRRTFDESPYRPGSEISEEELEELIGLSEQRRSREKAYYLLSLRDHSRKELEKKLQRTTDSATAAATVDRMEELGLVNDENFARNRANYLMLRKFYPAKRAVMELCALGIDRDTAQDAVDSLGCDDANQALALLNKKYYNSKVSKDKDGCRKMAAYLARYGFGGDAIRRALKEFIPIGQDFELDD